MTVEFVLPPSLPVKPPKHLDTKLFQEVLEYAIQDCEPVEIKRISFDAGSATGDNFLGVIYRVKLIYRRLAGAQSVKDDASAGGTVSVIIKFIPDSEANEFLHELNVFLKEKVFYRDVLPRLTTIAQGKEKFAAKLYHTVSDPLRTLIFEDLTVSNYEMACRLNGLDEVHCCTVLKKLGKFHGMSMILGKQEPEIMKCFHSGLVNRPVLKDGGLPHRYYSAEVAVLEAFVRSWPGYEKIADKVAKYRENLRENLLRCVAPCDDDIKVLNHGDMWVNNMLFQYENGVPKNTIFVDYQMSNWGSLGLDLNYFLNTSVQLQVLQQRREYLLRVYHASLRDALIEHSYKGDVPSFEQILREVRRREGWGFFASFAILPLIALDKEEGNDNNLDNMNNDEFALKKMQKMFAMPRTQDTLKYTLKRYDEKGLFEV